MISPQAMCRIMKIATSTATALSAAAQRRYSQANALAKEFWNPKLIAELDSLNDPESIILKLKMNEKSYQSRTRLAEPLILKLKRSTKLVVEDNRVGFRTTSGDYAMLWDEYDSFPIAFNYKGGSYTLKEYILFVPIECKSNLSLRLYYYNGSRCLKLNLKQKKSQARILLKNFEVVEEKAEWGPIEFNSIYHNQKKMDTFEFQNLLENSTRIQGREIKTILENNSRSANLELVLANNWQQKQFVMKAAGLMSTNVFVPMMLKASLLNPYTALFTIFSILCCYYTCPSGKPTDENRK